MTETIDAEKRRVLNELSKFQILLDDFKRQRYRPPHLDEFERLVKESYELLKREVRERLEEVTEHVTLEIASLAITNLRLRIKRLFDVMYRILSNSLKIKREIYYLTDIFLEYHDARKNYIIFVSDEIAMFSFLDILKSYGFDYWFPNFWEKMREKNIYFVQIVSEYNDPSSSLDWPIILHEMAHIVCDQKEIDRKFIPEMTVLEALQTVYHASERQGIPDAIVIQAKKKLYTIEHLADILVTRCFGGIYAWRFLKNHVSLVDIFEPGKSHPSPEERLKKIIHEIEYELKLSDSANFLKRQLRSFIGKIIQHGASNRSASINVNDILKQVLPEIRAYSKFKLTYQQIEKSIQGSTWFHILANKVKKYFHRTRFSRFLRDLQNQLLEGAPIIVDPPTLYFIATLEYSNEKGLSILDGDTHHSKLIRKLIADCIRLYSIKDKFLTEIIKNHNV